MGAPQLQGYTARMKTVRLALVALACSVPLLAAAQWQWVDKDGRRVFSDKAPPAEIAPDKILKRPRGAPQPAETALATPVSAPAAAAALPKPTGKDPALEQKRKQAEAEAAAKKAAEDEKVTVARAENCTRAKASKAGFDSGVRIARTNDKGEKEFLDDSQRAAEVKRLEQMIARDCK
jgi:hypothetical protein